MLAVFVLAICTSLTSAREAGTCTYTPKCDLGHGTRDSAPAKTKEECCSLCKAKTGCAAGVLSGGTCWFKTAESVAHGCTHSSKVDYACFSGSGPPRPAPAPSCNDPTCIALESEYDTIKNKTCASVVSHAPVPNAKDIVTFMKLYQAFKAQKGQDEAPIIALATKILGESQVQAFLSRPDAFSAGGLDAAMVQCAVMSDATSVGLAEFAKASSANKALITKLLADPILMRDMLVAGGAVSSETDKGKPGPKQYGPAMAIYEKIIAASNTLARIIENEKAAAAATSPPALWDDRSQQTVLKRFALGLALEHAVPIHLHYHTKECDQDYDWCPPNDPPEDANVTIIDPVARYMHYENAYKAGELDPAFEVLTSFECKHTSNSPASDEDLAWIRASMGIYRPENIAMSYHWRYARSVSTDVAYGDPMCAKWGPAVCSGHYASIPAADGVCGPRAFFGRATRLAFGLPTWGATQPGHAAMTTWSPDEGWHTLLGAGWFSCWWGDRSGPDWVLETQAREVRPDFQKVLRGTWVSIASGEAPASMDWGRGGGYGQGGPWAALMLYAKKIAAAKPPVPRVVGPSLVPSKVSALLAAWPAKLPTPQVTTTADRITIPAAAFTSKNRSCSLSVMKSNEAPYTTQQITHNGCASSVGPPCAVPTASSWQYTVTVESEGNYFLTANFTTWHMDQDLLVSVNNKGKQLTVPVYYSVGWWNQTQPLEVSLQKGTNTLSFYRTTTRPLVFKAFYLYKTKPSGIPKPPTNYTPSPAPHYPNASQYIEVPADTTCVKQGITPVPQEDCSRACLALGFKGTGPRARPNISGCFVMTQGQYSGNCNYNTNASAACTPPCTLYGSIVRSLCLRA